MTQGAAYSFLGKKLSRTDMERAVVVVDVRVDRETAALLADGVKAEMEAGARAEARRRRDWRVMVDYYLFASLSFENAKEVCYNSCKRNVYS